MGRQKAKGLGEYPYDERTRRKVDRFAIVFPEHGRLFFYACLEEIFAEGDGLSVSDPATVRILAGRTRCTVEEWRDMLTAALAMDLFDAGFYEQQLVLTSSGVKARWEIVAKKRLRSAQDYSSRKSSNEAISVTEIISVTDKTQKSSPSLPLPLPPTPLSPFSPPITPSLTPYTPPSDPLSVPPPPAPAKPGRKRDELWDAVVEAFGLKPKTRGDGSRIGRVVRNLRARGATPAELATRIGRYRAEWPKAACTMEAIDKHWDHFGADRAVGINGAATDRAALEKTMAQVFGDLEENHGI